MYTPAAVRDVRQFVFLNLEPTGKPGLRWRSSSFSLCNNTPLFLGHRPVHPRNFPFLFSSSSTKFSSNGCSQSGNGAHLTGFELDISTFATLSGTSLTHNSGMTFRSRVSTRLSASITAHLRAVQPSCPGRTHSSPVATIFSHWFVCSGALSDAAKLKGLSVVLEAGHAGTCYIIRNVTKGVRQGSVECRCASICLYALGVTQAQKKKTSASESHCTQWADWTCLTFAL